MRALGDAGRRIENLEGNGTMATIELERTSVAASNDNVTTAAIDFPEAFGDKQTLKRALFALQRGPIRFHRDNVIACEGDAADYLFLVVRGVVRHCKTFENGTRNIVAFYLPGDLFGWSDAKHGLSVEAAADAMVMFIKRAGLLSIASQEGRVASFLLATTTNDLRRSHEHSLLINKSATCRVATFLADLWTRSGKLKYLDLPVSHQDIADYLGVTIETLSRAITGMERSGVLNRVSARRLIIRNEMALEQMMR
jgi:CRP/FNR family nitrogen fixation transcriptional regulator